LACRARAQIAAAIGALADVPLKTSTQLWCRAVVGCNETSASNCCHRSGDCSFLPLCQSIASYSYRRCGAYGMMIFSHFHDFVPDPFRPFPPIFVILFPLKSHCHISIAITSQRHSRLSYTSIYDISQCKPGGQQVQGLAYTTTFSMGVFRIFEVPDSQ